MPSRTILIGLDGASFTVLDPLLCDGLMPVLRGIIDSGVRAVLRSTTHPLTPPAWTSLMTGRTPGNHGIMDFFRPDSDDPRLLTILTGRDVRCETIWSMANRAGLTVTALNFPMMTPPRPIEGTVIPGWAPLRHLRLSSRPRGILERLRAGGVDVRDLSTDLNEEGRALEGMPAVEAIDWIRQHTQREACWRAITRRLMTDSPAPLTAILVDGVDKIQHLCYRLLDPALRGDGYSAEDARVRQEAIRYFRALDDHIGEIAQLAGPKARVFLASDHGFGPWTHIVYLNAWLQQHGYLAWASGPAAVAGDLGLEAPRKQIALLDWPRTTAYGLSVSGNGIRIRRAGEPGGGGVAPEDYHAVRQKLAGELMQLRDPETGDSVVRRVLTREEAYPGAAMEEAPDLTVRMRDYGFVSLQPSDVAIRRRAVSFGTHHPDGIFVATGPGLCHGAALDPLSIVDVASILLYSLNVAAPANLEGGVPDGLFEPDLLRSQPMRKGPPTVLQAAFPTKAGDLTMSARDEAEISGRLKALGYVE